MVPMSSAPARRSQALLKSLTLLNPKTTPATALPRTRQMSSDSSAAGKSSATFFEAIKARRTYYALSAKSPIPDSQIKKIVEQAILHVPSSFNSQSTRAIVLLKSEHEKLWDITHETLRKMLEPQGNFEGTSQKLKGFKAGYGTVLWFEDQEVIRTFEEKFAAYKEHFPGWGLQSNAMHQFAVWTALELEGFGANLQHYNPLIDEEVQKSWNVPKSWKLISQQVFGTPVQQPGEKTFQPLEERLKVYGDK